MRDKYTNNYIDNMRFTRMLTRLTKNLVHHTPTDLPESERYLCYVGTINLLIQLYTLALSGEEHARILSPR